MSRMWSSGGILGAVALILLAITVYKWKDAQKVTMPDEVKNARLAFDKLSAALEVGMPIMEYNRLLIDAKVAVDAADTKLPYFSEALITSAVEDSYSNDQNTELQVAHKTMGDVMTLHKQALFVWNTKIKGQRLWDTPEGSRIRWDHRFEATMTEDQILQALWSKASAKALRFQIATNVYAK